MATFLTRKGIVHHLDRIIDEADEELILISPYIKADEETKGLLRDKTRATAIHVIYGKKELMPSEKSFFDSLGIRTTFLKHLHAKCYLNEKEALLTSMNLYQFSQEHNDEMGILVSKQDDVELYEAISRQATKWKASGSEARDRQTRPDGLSNEKPRGPGKRGFRRNLEGGFCIRCRAALPVNPEQPYCKRCYRNWNRYKNTTYEEEHCHTCGRKHPVTLLKPLCRDCYAEYKVTPS